MAAFTNSLAPGMTSHPWEMGDIVNSARKHGRHGRATCGGRPGARGIFLTDSHINDPAHWQRRAEEARAHAEQLADPESRRMMLDIAEDYEKLAKRAEERLRGSPQSN